MTGWPLFSRSPSTAEPGSRWHLAAGCALHHVSTADATLAAAGMAECPEKVALGRLSLGPGSWAGGRGMLWGAGGAPLIHAAHRPRDPTCSGVGGGMGTHQALFSPFSRALPTCRSLWAMCVTEELSEPRVFYFP